MITTAYTFNQYRPLYKMKTDLNKLKTKLVKEIMGKVKPLMWETGFVTGKIGESKPLNAFFFENSKYYKIKNPITPNLEFCGFTEQNAIVTDAYMGIATMNMNDLPIEDLFKVHCWVMADRYKVLKKKSY